MHTRKGFRATMSAYSYIASLAPPLPKEHDLKKLRWNLLLNFDDQYTPTFH